VAGWDRAIIFLLFKERLPALDLYKEGGLETTYASQIPVTSATLGNQLEIREKKDYLTAPFGMIGYLSINTTMAPLNDVNVRRALSMAINRQIIANQLPEAQPFNGFVPLMVGYDVAEGTDFNPQKARDLLRAAGFPEGRGFPEIEVSFAEGPTNRRVTEAAQRMLQNELGIHVTLVGQDSADWFPSRWKLTYKGLSFGVYLADYIDPTDFLGEFAEADNDTGWWDPKLKERLRKANAENDPDMRGLLLRGVEKSLLEAQPVIPLYLSNSSLMRKPYVRNFEPNLLDRHYWRGVYIDHSVRY
jgi:oligopeptide transport system substrate-binding protein